MKHNTIHRVLFGLREVLHSRWWALGFLIGPSFQILNPKHYVVGLGFAKGPGA